MPGVVEPKSQFRHKNYTFQFAIPLLTLNSELTLADIEKRNSDNQLGSSCIFMT